MAHLINKEICTSCGMCYPACPVAAIRSSEDEKYEIMQDACDDCGECVSVCTPGAIDKL